MSLPSIQSRERIMEFQKISREQALKDLKTVCELENDDDAFFNEVYEMVKIPQRATKGSAGYDFYSPYYFVLKPGQTIKIPTLMRVELKNYTFLMVVPRSGLGFKYKLTLDNTVGIIDQDYYYSDNEGHIWAKMTNNSEKILKIAPGEAFAQGIIVPFMTVDNDNAKGIRNGGFGSTTK